MYRRIRRLSVCVTFLILFSLCTVFLMPRATAVSPSDYPGGTYELDAELSCYVNAMGGCEFGGPLLQSAEMTVEEDGSAELTLTFGKSSVTIYGVTCDTFVDASPAYVTEDRGVASGTIGYYDADGTLHTEDVTYTLSEDTALNPNNEAVHYVDSITFPLDDLRESYALTLYVNSNVMGVQFCQPNDEADSATYSATLTVFWDGVPQAEAAEEEEIEVVGEEMDGLTLYRAEEDAEDESSDPDAAEPEEKAESESETSDRGLLIALAVIGGVLIALGVASLTLNLVSGKRNRKNETDGVDTHESDEKKE